MTNCKIFGYKYIDDLTYAPKNTHLFIETETALYFVSATDETKLYKYTISTETESLIETRTRKIQGAWYDRDNDYIYFVSCNQADTQFTCWYLDLSDDSVSELGSKAGLTDVDAFDIWRMHNQADADYAIYVLIHENDGGDKIAVYKWVDPNWNQEDTQNGTNASIVVPVLAYADPDYYSAIFILENSGNSYVAIYDDFIGYSGIGILSGAIAGTIPTNRSQVGIASDNAGIGIDKYYFIIDFTADSNRYLYIYDLDADTETQLGQYNVCLMSDRNCNTDIYDSDGNYRISCFRREKGFGGDDAPDNTRMIVYQIPRTYTGNLDLIANALRSMPKSTIIAISDSYLVIEKSDNTIELYEYTDLVAEGQIYDVDIIHPEREYPDCTLLWRKTQTNDTNKYFDPTAQDQLLQVYGTYTSTNGVANIVSDESLYLSYRGAHNFSGITTTANYFKGSGGLNYETVGTSGTDIAWVDSATLYDGACEIVESWQGHYNVIQLQDDATAGEYPSIVHNITQATSGIWEAYIGTSDVTKAFNIILQETAVGNIIRIKFAASKLQYYDSLDVWQDIQAVANDTLYHLKVQWYADNTFDVTVDGTLQVDGVACNNNQTSGIEKITIVSYADSVDYFYLDAPGLVGETDPQGYTYEESWNTLDGDIDELLDEGYKIYGALGGSYIRVIDLDGHKDVLDLYDNQGNIDYADAVRFRIWETQTYGSYEFHIRCSDATYQHIIQVFGTGGTLFYLEIDSDKFQYNDGGWNDVGLGASDDTWYHIRIAFECTAGGYEGLAQYDWKIWINGVEYGSYDMANNASNATLIQFYTSATDSAYHFYIDAIDFSWETNYVRQRSRVLSLDDQIIFEGLTDSHDRNILTDISGISKSTELDTISPKISDYTDYTGKTSGAIITQLISDFCNYITAGTISTGSTTWTCPADWSVNGNKSLRSIINEFADTEYFTWSIRPTGELDFDDGSVSSYVTLTNSDNYENPHVNILSEKYNQVIIYGGYVNSSRMGPYTYNNQASQQLHGIITWTKTYAGLYDATILQTLADNKGALQGAAPLIWEAERDMIDNKNDFGFIQPHETIYLSEGVLVGDDSDETISSTEAGEYILSVNQYDGLNDDSRLKIIDGLLFKEDIKITLSEQNSELITQIAVETQMVAYPDASVSSGDHNAEGIKSTFTAGENVVFGDFCYFKSDGKMWKSDADAAATMPIVAMAIETITADNTGLFLLTGIARDDTWNWATIGGLLYGSCTTGEITQTAPVGSGDQVQLVGWAITADIIYFKPDFELTAIP